MTPNHMSCAGQWHCKKTSPFLYHSSKILQKPLNWQIISCTTRGQDPVQTTCLFSLGFYFQHTYFHFQLLYLCWSWQKPEWSETSRRGTASCRQQAHNECKDKLTPSRVGFAFCLFFTRSSQVDFFTSFSQSLLMVSSGEVLPLPPQPSHTSAMSSGLVKEKLCPASWYALV